MQNRYYWGLKISTSNWSETLEQNSLNKFIKHLVNDLHNTDQMAEWYRASASGSVDLGLDSESGQTNDFNIGIHSFPA